MVVKRKKLKLRPSARDKRRYFLVRAKNSEIENAILDYIGVLGFARACYLRVVAKGFVGFSVGSCLASSLDEVRAGLALAGIEIEKVSGTIKGLGSSKN
jgi:hypothetical protein